MPRASQPHRISVRVSPKLARSLRQRTKLTGKSESEIVREAVESHLAAPPKRESMYDVFVRRGLLGAAKNLPPDLSTNPKYMEGFGESNSDPRR